MDLDLFKLLPSKIIDIIIHEIIKDLKQLTIPIKFLFAENKKLGETLDEPCLQTHKYKEKHNIRTCLTKWNTQ